MYDAGRDQSIGSSSLRIGLPVFVQSQKGGAAPKVTKRRIASHKAPNGVQTVVEEQEVDAVRYFDAGGIPGRTVGLTGK